MAFPVDRAAGRDVLLVDADMSIMHRYIEGEYRVDYRGMERDRESSSTIRGTGVHASDADFDMDAAGSGIYPRFPGVVGCSHWG